MDMDGINTDVVNKIISSPVSIHQQQLMTSLKLGALHLYSVFQTILLAPAKPPTIGAFSFLGTFVYSCLT